MKLKITIMKQNHDTSKHSKTSVPFMISFSFKEIWPFHTCWKMVKHTFKFLQCSHRKISKVCLTIFQHYEWREGLNNLFFDNLAKRVDIFPLFSITEFPDLRFTYTKKTVAFPNIQMLRTLSISIIGEY